MKRGWREVLWVWGYDERVGRRKYAHQCVAGKFPFPGPKGQRAVIRLCQGVCPDWALTLTLRTLMVMISHKHNVLNIVYIIRKHIRICILTTSQAFGCSSRFWKFCRCFAGSFQKQQSLELQLGSLILRKLVAKLLGCSLISAEVFLN